MYKDPIKGYEEDSTQGQSLLVHFRDGSVVIEAVLRRSLIIFLLRDSFLHDSLVLGALVSLQKEDKKGDVCLPLSLCVSLSLCLSVFPSLSISLSDVRSLTIISTAYAPARNRM